MTRPRQFTPQAIENICARYVNTDESLDSIASDFGVHRETIGRLAVAHKWPLRKNRPPRDLPSALKLDLAAADTLAAARDLGTPQAGSASATANEPDGADASLVSRLEQAVARELLKVEQLKDDVGSETSRSRAAERVARTLASLTQTLSKVRALREPGSGSVHEHSDLPADPDVFRTALAERMDAFVRSRTDGGVSQDAGASDAGSAQ